MEIIGSIVIVILTMVVLYLFFFSEKKSVKPTQPTGATPVAGAATAAATPKKMAVPGWFKKHWFMTIVAVLLCLTFLPQIVGFGGWVLAAIASGPDQVFRGTPRSEWGVISPTPEIILPPGKCVGGPLYWNTGAKVKLRPRASKEPMDKAAKSFFAGIIPPGGSIKATYEAKMPKSMKWDASLVDYTTSEGYRPIEEIENDRTTKKGVPVGVFSMPSLSRTGEFRETFSNNSHELLELYIQTQIEEWVKEDGEKPPIMYVTHDDNGSVTAQYEVEVGLNETSFTIPYQHCESLWVAPVHHEAYQASVTDMPPIPSRGVKIDGCDNYLAILVSVGGDASVLEKALLLQSTEAQGGVTVSLVLNSGVDNIKEGSVTPATVIVGIKL